jgi:hypothetical protein
MTPQKLGEMLPRFVCAILEKRAEALAAGMTAWEADDVRELNPWYDLQPHPWYSEGYTFEAIRDMRLARGNPPNGAILPTRAGNQAIWPGQLLS